ncbi:MAG: sulfotransferase, partial [Chromatiaceae bacterium]|nr:sulfotransferase [Chromatiaceae bacterium]
RRAEALGWRGKLGFRQLLDQARRDTGLDDWGDDYFLEPLERLVDALNREAALTASGRYLMRGVLCRGVCNQLLLQRHLREHPDALEQPLAALFIVVGMPRTGTTLLYNLLAQDPAARPLLGWESLYPVHTGTSRGGARDRRRERAARLVRGINHLVPELQGVHAFSADGPEECTWLMANSFISPVYSMFARVPSYTNWLWKLDEAAWEPVYRDYRRQLLAVQHQRGGARWLLKSPVHLMSLGPLLRVLPEARILFTQRDPCQVVPSTCSLFALLRGLYSDDVDPSALGQEIVTDLTRAYERAMGVLIRYPDKVVGVEYLDLVSDKTGTVQALYKYLGVPYDGPASSGVENWIAEDRHRSVHRYRLEQFGLTQSDIVNRFPSAERGLADG